MSIAEELTTIAENEQKVYDAGYEKGKAEGGVQHSDYINPEWTDWRYFGAYGARESLVAKLKYEDTSNGTNFNSMFVSNAAMTSVPLFDTSKGKDCSYMFQHCISLKEVPEFNLSNATTTSNMFYQCDDVTEFPSFNLTKSTSCSYMFAYCKKLKEMRLDAPKATAIEYIFSGCEELEKVELLTSSANRTYQGAFKGCYKLTEISPLEMSNIGNVSDMFSGCSALKSAPKLDLTKCNFVSNMFKNCTALENVEFIGTIKTSGLDLQYSTLLSKTSIISIITALLSSATGTKKITLSLTAVNNAFETSEGVADGSTSAEWLELVATKSNWTISLV